MKKVFQLFVVIAAFFTTFSFAQVGIGTTTPDASSILEVQSTTKGFLPPRVTQSQRDAIASPAKGLVVYCTDCKSGAGCLQVNDGTPGTPSWSCVGTGSSNSTGGISIVCNGFITGTYVRNVAISGTYTVTLTNTSLSSATITPAIGDLTYSGVTGTITTTAVSPSVATTLLSGNSLTITYTVSGTPTSVGTLVGTWAKLAYNCSKTKEIVSGTATFTLPQTGYVVSIYDGSPITDIQGYIDNNSNKIIVNVPYTGGLGSYNAYSGTAVLGIAGQGGDLNSFSISYPAGIFAASGSIPVTITVDGDGSYSANKKLFAAQETIVNLPFFNNGTNFGTIILKAIGGIPDRMFGLADNTGATNTHNFIYLPVIAADGRTWLNNNLGADYANMNYAGFNPLQQASSQSDYHAFGSLFQFGRKGDGHELINWTNASSSTAVNGVSATKSDAPNHGMFIKQTTVPYDWRVNANGTLWASETSANNPCPIGYRIPTAIEALALLAAENINSTSTAATSTLKLTSVGYRGFFDATFSYGNITGGSIWTSTPENPNTLTIYFNSSGAGSGAGSGSARASGLTVRCIKD